jgi:phage gpG-like protein
MINIKIKVDKKDLKHIEEMPKRMTEGLFEGMKRALTLAEKSTKSVYLSGKALKRRTSFLYNAIGTEVKKKSMGVVGSLGTLKYDVPYGAFWEFGGKYGKRSFIKPAIDDSMNEMLVIIGRSATKEMNE